MPWGLFPRAGVAALAGEVAIADRASAPAADVWFLPDMHAQAKKKCRRMRLEASPDLRALRWSYASRRARGVLEWQLQLALVARVRVGVPTQEQPPPPPPPSEGGAAAAAAAAPSPPKPRRGLADLFSFRSASNVRSLVLEDAAHTLFHAELPAADGGAQLDALLRALSVLACYARARAGAREPMPELPAAPLRVALAAASAQGAGAAAAAAAAAAAGAAGGSTATAAAAAAAAAAAQPPLKPMAPSTSAAAASASGGLAGALVVEDYGAAPRPTTPRLQAAALRA